MARLYLFLAEHGNSKAILETFKAQPAVFFPSSSSNAREDVIQGCLLSLDNVFWDDQTGALTMLHTLDASSRKMKSPALRVRNSVKSISGYYPELRTFFVEQSLVREKPDFYGYTSILKELAALTLPSSVLKEVLTYDVCVPMIFYFFHPDLQIGSLFKLLWVSLF